MSRCSHWSTQVCYCLCSQPQQVANSKHKISNFFAPKSAPKAAKISPRCHHLRRQWSQKLVKPIWLLPALLLAMAVQVQLEHMFRDRVLLLDISSQHGSIISSGSDTTRNRSISFASGVVKGGRAMFTNGKSALVPKVNDFDRHESTADYTFPASAQASVPK